MLSHNRAVRYIVIATLVAGVLDILMAFANVSISSGGKPAMVLRYIASGIYGRKAFTGGREYEAAGLGLHFLITFVCVIVYFLAFSRHEKIKRNWLIAGIIYGLIICVFMNFVVLPLSETPPANPAFYTLFKAVIIQIVATGIPITWLLRRY